VTPIRRLRFSSPTETRLRDSGLDVVVTGAGGWLGRATLEMLESSLGDEIAAHVHVFASSGRSMTLRSGAELEVAPLGDLARLRIGPHLLAHYAFGTRDLVPKLGAATYIARNEEITKLVARHVERSRPTGMVIPSSGAVYLGSDLATNPYGVLKQRDEHRFFALAEKLGEEGVVPRVVVPRVFNLAGPFLNKPGYVLGSIIRDLGQGGPVRLHATRPVVRSYMHIENVVDLAFAMMLGEWPTPLVAFDTAGEREIEVSQLADLAISILGPPDAAIIRPAFDGSPADRYVGNGSVINALARSYGLELYPLARQIEDTAVFMDDRTS
jgi:UDP-glucuronate decarboxylase